MTQPLGGPENGPLWVLDADGLIDFKKVPPIGEQWEFGEQMLELVRRGDIIFPAQVRAELTDSRIIAHPDVPGAWVARAWKLMKPRPSPDDRTVQQILSNHPELVRVDAERDQADPYVAALAFESAQAGHAVTVVTKDAALRGACISLGIDVVSWDEFVADVRA